MYPVVQFDGDHDPRVVGERWRQVVEGSSPKKTIPEKPLYKEVDPYVTVPLMTYLYRGPGKKLVGRKGRWTL